MDTLRIPGLGGKKCWASARRLDLLERLEVSARLTPPHLGFLQHQQDQRQNDKRRDTIGSAEQSCRGMERHSEGHAASCPGASRKPVRNYAPCEAHFWRSCPLPILAPFFPLA